MTGSVGNTASPGSATRDVDAVTTFYGRWAGLYDLVARHTPGIAPVRARTIEALALEPGDVVVEMGCGTGANVPYLADHVAPDGRVVGLDLTPGVLARARAVTERRERTGTAFVRGDAARPPVRTADAVLATFVVGMLDDPSAAIDNWCDLVGPGDRVALLDATLTDRPAFRPLNVLFRGFVTLTAPPGTRLRYEESPAGVLDRRVATARRALAERGEIVVDETAVLGFLRLTVAQL